MKKARRPPRAGAARPRVRARARSILFRFAAGAGRMVLGVLPRALRPRAANDPEG